MVQQTVNRQIIYRHFAFPLILIALAVIAVLHPAQAQPTEPGNMVLRLPADTVDTGVVMNGLRKAVKLEDDHPDSALQLLEVAKMQSMQLKFNYGLAIAYFHEGNAYINKGAYEQARNNYRYAVSYSVFSEKGRRMLPSIFNNLGLIFNMQGDYDQALVYYNKAVAVADQLPSAPGADYAYSNMAAVLSQLGYSEHKSLYYLDKAEKAARESNNYDLLAMVLINKGFASNMQKSWDTSRRYFEAALALAEKHHLLNTHYLALVNLGSIRIELQEPKEALKYLLKAEEIRSNIYPGYRNLCLRNMGEAYRLLKDYAQSERCLLKALHIARTLGMGQELQDSYRLLANLYEEKGSYTQAHSYLQSYLTLKDSLESKEVEANVNALEIRYRTAQKDKELLGQQLLISRQQDTLRQKNVWILATSLSALFVVILSLVLYRSSRHRQNLQKEKIHNLQQEQQIGELKAMISGEEKERSRIARELHDGIGGLLSAVKMNSVVLKKEYDFLAGNDTYQNMIRMLEDMGTEIRKTSHNLMPDVLLRHSLPEAIRHFCDSLQKAGTLRIDIQSYGNFDRLGYNFRLSVYRMVQELMQNIVKHAEAENVIVQLIHYDHTLGITVEDDGNGFDVDQPTEGIGLRNLRDRVRSLNGQINVDTRPGEGTTVYIELEIKNETRTGT